MPSEAGSALAAGYSFEKSAFSSIQAL